MGKVAIIGGSGILNTSIFNKDKWNICDTEYNTEYGDGRISYQMSDDIIFIPRHGEDIKLSPGKTEYLANLLAAKRLGASCVIATSAVGTYSSAVNDIGSLVIPDDVIDETGRNNEVFGKDLIIHPSPRPPFSEPLRNILIETAQAFVKEEEVAAYNDKAIYVCIQGPSFGTKAEGRKRSQYADIVGMTVCPEYQIALQLDLHYAILAVPVDEDIDANHEQTIRVIKEMESILPRYILEVARKAMPLAENPGKLPQLENNIFCGTIEYFENRFLEMIAEGIMNKYC
jgi:5'-methylthioadenosine phosphorylase